MFLLDDNLFRVFSILCFFIYKKIFIAYLLIFSKKDFLKRFAPLTFLSGRVFSKKDLFSVLVLFYFLFFRNQKKENKKEPFVLTSYRKTFSPKKVFRNPFYPPYTPKGYYPEKIRGSIPLGYRDTNPFR